MRRRAAWAAILYCFLRISICMASGEQDNREFGGSTAKPTDAPSALASADVNACAGSLKSSNRARLIRIWTPLPSASGIPMSPNGSVTKDSEDDCHFQPDFCSKAIRLLTKPSSAAGSLSIANGMEGNGLSFSTIAIAPSELMTRGITFFSRKANFNSASFWRALASAAAAFASSPRAFASAIFWSDLFGFCQQPYTTQTKKPTMLRAQQNQVLRPRT